MDWAGEPFHFWYFEGLRSAYWFGFGLFFAGVYLIGWLWLRRFSAVLVPAILGVICSIATEVMTSIYFWRSLSSNQANDLGWPNFREYFSEHLVSWAVVLVILGPCLWYLQHRRRSSHGHMATSS